MLTAYSIVCNTIQVHIFTGAMAQKIYTSISLRALDVSQCNTDELMILKVMHSK